MINNKIKSIAKKYELSKDDFWLHKQSGNWDFPREVYENNGIATLDTMAK